VGFVRRFDKPVAIKTHCPDETWSKRAYDDEFRRTPKLLSNFIGRREAVVTGLCNECKGRVKQCFAPERYECVNVPVSQFPDHREGWRL
jgi:hypothetical protein